MAGPLKFSNFSCCLPLSIALQIFARGELVLPSNARGHLRLSANRSHVGALHDSGYVLPLGRGFVLSWHAPTIFRVFQCVQYIRVLNLSWNDIT